MDSTKLENLLGQLAALSPELAAGIEELTNSQPTNLDGNDIEDRLLSKADPRTGPLPPKNSITFMQTTLWDNGAEKKVTKNGNTSKRTRYTVTIEAYTMPLERLVTLGLINTYQFKRNVQLRSRDRFVPLVKKNHASGRIDRDFHDFLIEYTNDTYIDPDDLFGFVLDAGTWNYHSDQFLHLKWATSGEPRLFVVHGDDMTEVNTWDEIENPKGEARKKYENEIDNCGYRNAQRTNSATKKGTGRRPR